MFFDYRTVVWNTLEYRHKPYIIYMYIARNLESLGYIFVTESVDLSSFKFYGDLRKTRVFWNGVHNDHSKSPKSPRSLILAPIESAYKTSYWSPIVLFCRVSLILQLLYAESHFFRTPPDSGENFGCSPWSRSVTLGRGYKERTPQAINNREVIFENLTKVITVPQRYWRTDRRTTCRGNSALCVA